MFEILLFLVAIFSVLVRPENTNSSVTALSIPASAYWDGVDGWWSTHQVQVGTPGQTLRLLPGTSASAGSTLWAVIDEGCTAANPNLTNCAFERGYLFHRNQSTSWSTERLPAGTEIYNLLTFEESALGLTGNAYYGFDTIKLGVPGSGLPTVENQVIAGFATNNYWLGSLPLSPKAFNISDLNNPQPSLLSTLYNQSLIPSLAWAYTAGAHYHDPAVFGSLTLGGYDTTRFTTNNVTFSFGADFSRDLLVSLESITYDSFGSAPLLTSPIDIFIDSMVTHIWLPVEVCEAFEKAFNLTWDADSELYIVDTATHKALLAQNPSFTFTIANLNGDTVDIIFPYAAFDLNITAPLVESESRYFPLKQAQNSSQYTLGRVFFQQAYVVADYNRANFSVSQALFPGTDVAQNIISIRPPGWKADDGDGGSSVLSPGAIAGIVVTAVVVLGAIVGIIIWRTRRTTRMRKNEEKPHDAYLPPGDQQNYLQDTKHEVEATSVQELDVPRPELASHDSSDGRFELFSPTKVHEAASNHVHAVELEAPSR